MFPALLLAAFASAPPTPALAPDEVLRRSAVRTHHAVHTGGGPRSTGVVTTQSGSGTVVSVAPGCMLVLSCRHVTRHESGRLGRLRVVTYDGVAHPATVLADDADADLSLIEVRLARPTKAVAARVAAGEEYTPGTEVIKVGFPGGGRRVITEGKILPVTNHAVGKPDVVSTVASAQSVPGDSGGGLFRISDHALVGVVWGGKEDGLRASRLADVHRLILKAKVKLD